jgi:predicted ATPase
MAVLCGANGTGKSSVLDAIRFVRDLALGNAFLYGMESDFMRLDFTSWLNSSMQEFEMEFLFDGHHLSYAIHLQQANHLKPAKVIKEIAICDGKELYSMDADGLHMIGLIFPLDDHQAALSSINTSNLPEIGLLQSAFSSILVVRPNVLAFEAESKSENFFPFHDLSNIISWYRFLSQDLDWTDTLRGSLEEVWPNDFRSLKLNGAGASAKWLEIRFEGANLRFDQLSDGEKTIICLYMIRSALSVGNINSVLIDEPDNHVSLQELQPWLFSMLELIDLNHQVLIVSHSSEILESNPSCGVYFWRDNHSSPTRAGYIRVPDGLTISEALARGWATGGAMGGVNENV